ncbi:uncharacterized protein J4E84_002832 [Alternaria hordeiaustralica]|uniref:uncharacterized protein n=1 Tax=Alternaria hordeiaustralica TaxID=1187925 RepID=UPI0020C4072A|nr:uncharacterized protein J4E84_002832 [Alternaria hordeiaustralica]KAI4694250.1 hypothetical protein J4E84_002832 [Alternaria hordeiaustralica]
MPPSVQKFLDDLNQHPVTVPFVDVPNDMPYWGFTIYRTYYGPGSDQRWSELLQRMTTETKLDLESQDGAEDDTTSTAKAWSLFKLDARSDSTVLDGLTLEQVRQLYVEGVGGRPMNAADNPFRVFFLADAEALVGSDFDSALIKVVAAEYDAAACVPVNWKFGPQRYFGWMRMPVRCVLALWFTLEHKFLQEIVDSTAGGPGALWDRPL